MKLKNPWRDKTRSRIRKLGPAALLDWADQAMVGSWRAMDRYGKSGEITDLEEARKEGGVYLAILEELAERMAADNRAF